MAWPTGYTLYDQLVIDPAKVGGSSGTLSSFVLYVSGATLSSQFWSTVRSDGGDIRASLNDGTTQVPLQVVAIDTGGQTAEIHIGPIAVDKAASTTIRLWYNGTDTTEVATATYGSEAVWANHTAAYHLQETPTTVPENAGANDYTESYGADMTSGDSVSGKLTGKGLNFDGGANDYVSIASHSTFNPGTGAFELSCWIKPANSNQNDGIIAKLQGSGSFPGYVLYQGTGQSDGSVAASKKLTVILINNFSVNDYYAATDDDVADGNWHLVRWTRTGSTSTLYVDGTAKAMTVVRNNGTGAGSDPDNSVSLDIGMDRSNVWVGDVDELRWTKGAVRDADWDLTEFNNQHDPSTFYSVTAIGAGGPFPHYVRRARSLAGGMISLGI